MLWPRSLGALVLGVTHWALANHIVSSKVCLPLIKIGRRSIYISFLATGKLRPLIELRSVCGWPLIMVRFLQFWLSRCCLSSLLAKISVVYVSDGQPYVPAAPLLLAPRITYLNKILSTPNCNAIHINRAANKDCMSAVGRCGPFYVAHCVGNPLPLLKERFTTTFSLQFERLTPIYEGKRIPPQGIREPTLDEL